MRVNNSSIIYLPPHGDISQGSHVTDPGIGHWLRGAGDVYTILIMCVGISGVPSGGVPRKGTQPRKTQGALHVQTLEFPNRNSTEGPATTHGV